MGEWQRQNSTWWLYIITDEDGRGHLFGHVRRRRIDGPLAVLWDAIVVGEGVGDDLTLRRGVSFMEAAEAIEQAAAALATPAEQAGVIVA